MGQGALLGRFAEEHADDRPHVRLHVDDEHLFVIAHEERASTVGGQDTADLDRNHIVLHSHSLGRNFRKNKPLANWYLYGAGSASPPRALRWFGAASASSGQQRPATALLRCCMRIVTTDLRRIFDGIRHFLSYGSPTWRRRRASPPPPVIHSAQKLRWYGRRIRPGGRGGVVGQIRPQPAL